jgi:hypothetical protein
MASSLGAPWGADQKDAAQLAWLLLAAVSECAGRSRLNAAA